MLLVKISMPALWKMPLSGRGRSGRHLIQWSAVSWLESPAAPSLPGRKDNVWRKGIELFTLGFVALFLELMVDSVGSRGRKAGGLLRQPDAD